MGFGFFFCTYGGYTSLCDLVVVRTPPDNRDHDGRGGAGWAGGEDDHVDDEDETAGSEDSDDDGEDGVQLLLLLSLVNTHGFRAPGPEKLFCDLFIFLFRPVPTVQHTFLLHPP